MWGGTLGTQASAYWDTNTSGVTDLSKGAGNVSNAPGITGIKTAKLRAGLPAGFDAATWGISSDINNGFPYLIGEPPAP